VAEGGVGGATGAREKARPARGRGRDVLFVVASLVMAGLFARLGIWQLHRLGERRARNALVASRLAAEPVPLEELPRDSALAHFRRVKFAGTYDFTHEMVLTNRIHDGSPGVNLVTPLRPYVGLGGDTVVLVDRGWVYSPDGASVDQTKWREAQRAAGTGYVQEFSNSPAPAATSPDHPERLRWLDPMTVAGWSGYPVAHYYLAVEADSDHLETDVPVRIPVPPLDEGPHMSYAIQWFAFAAIALVGPFFALRARK
jgi:surfeit locus 1 family protein